MLKLCVYTKMLKILHTGTSECNFTSIVERSLYDLKRVGITQDQTRLRNCSTFSSRVHKR
jgi:hypothetical protein